MQGEKESAKNENLPATEEGKKPYTLFHGHSGPVYSATFSPFGEFLLSSSSDSTSKTFLLGWTASYLLVYQVLFILHILNIALCLASVRLWSTKLNTNLVCYKGHNYPVWDVQVRKEKLPFSFMFHVKCKISYLQKFWLILMFNYKSWICCSFEFWMLCPLNFATKMTCKFVIILSMMCRPFSVYPQLRFACEFWVKCCLWD